MTEGSLIHAALLRIEKTLQDHLDKIEKLDKLMRESIIPKHIVVQNNPKVIYTIKANMTKLITEYYEVHEAPLNFGALSRQFGTRCKKEGVSYQKLLEELEAEEQVKIIKSRTGGSFVMPLDSYLQLDSRVTDVFLEYGGGKRAVQELDRVNNVLAVEKDEL